jgi:hypothetical protein
MLGKAVHKNKNSHKPEGTPMSSDVDVTSAFSFRKTRSAEVKSVPTT